MEILKKVIAHTFFYLQMLLYVAMIVVAVSVSWDIWQRAGYYKSLEKELMWMTKQTDRSLRIINYLIDKHGVYYKKMLIEMETEKSEIEGETK